MTEHEARLQGRSGSRQAPGLSPEVIERTRRQAWRAFTQRELSEDELAAELLRLDRQVEAWWRRREDQSARRVGQR